MDRKAIAIIFAILAAVCYAVNVPFSKMLLDDVGPSMMSSFLYIGAGLSMGLLFMFRRRKIRDEDLLQRSDLPYAVGMVVLDIAAPILLMYGISMTTSENVSLMNNFEIAFTALIALVLFGERVSRKLWIAIMLITVSGILLSVDSTDGFAINAGSLCVLGACACWGLENNCTRAISSRESSQIVMVKGLCSGTGCFIIALATGEVVPDYMYVMAALILGCISYGMSINLYILAQREIGAARTGAYYAVAPFIGVFFALVFFPEIPGWRFFLAFAIMILATVMVVADTMECDYSLRRVLRVFRNRHNPHGS